MALTEPTPGRPDPASTVAVAPGTCPFTIDRPVMRQRWERLTFLHWPFEVAAVQRLLPPGPSLTLGRSGFDLAVARRCR